MPYGPSKNSIWLGIMASSTALVMGACLCGFILLVFSPSPARHGLIAGAIVLGAVGAVVLPFRFPRFHVFRLAPSLWRWVRRDRAVKAHRTRWPVKKHGPATLPGEVFFDDREYPNRPAEDRVFVPMREPGRRSGD